MSKFKHFAIYCHSEKSIDQFLNMLKAGGNKSFPDLSKMQVLEFSDAVLKDFVADDHKHGNSLLAEDGRSLQSYSSGEKRKALLSYLLSKDPEWLLVQDIFDCLDVATVAKLKNDLQQRSSEMGVIQILKRKEDLLDFINVVCIENGDKLLPISAEEFRKRAIKNSNFCADLPESTSKFQVPEILFSLKSVSVAHFNKPILNNISWEVKKGEFWRLSGPNGSGKTTILDMVFGDNPKAYGTDLQIFGKQKGSGESVWEIKKKIGYFTPGMDQLFSRRDTVLHMLVGGLNDSVGLYQKPTFSQKKLAGEWLKLIGLEHKADHVYYKLPLLEKRLILIARAMIKNPPLLILDEPTTGLDDRSAAVMIDLVNHIAKKNREMAIVYVAHRNEKGLEPDRELQLKPSQNGSTSEIK